METLNTGIELTVIGMKLVFAVLILLATLIATGMRLVDRAGSRAADQPAPENNAAEQARPALTLHRLMPPDQPDNRSDRQPSADELAAIAIAVQLHQTVRRKQAAPAMRTHQPGTLPSRWLAIGRTRQNRTWQRR